ncbi:hypothetical protein DYB37_010624 [Aphanomyces astaci]|uniref:Non-haem dioxygenase N-terminal domain-containing protein n=1 Tax=Aphanomyces astaci TaxID=112090 RepID=A0A3R7AXL3_APHAT|nr:hypothetical protein DYB37_010624 [Aphanomyces astaci]
MSQEQAQPAIRTANVSVVDYATLAQGGDCGALIEAAFGPDGLGILAVANVPDIEVRRARCLPLAFKVATLSDEVKQKYELGSAYYSFGWSHGKESLQGKPDFSKGSYYNNPRTNRPTEDEHLMTTFPTMYHPNIWPTDEVPDLEPAFMSLGQLIIDTGLLVAKQCDAYVEIGESSQILTGGILQATPHAVRGPQVTGVNRETLAVFMSVEHDEPMRVPDTMDPHAAGQTTHLPAGVPSLLSRWNNSMLFHEFTAQTHKAYYDLQHQH